ncbi:unnamed protein product [Paramecium sonneborni]|uniref:EGF-like domain-containing protein n=1 Tax=Paramecium sonneborni TaxID=65129 RepID=A0A8S1RC56_9CILI|nr:unnamed protein product [Paramecium sonneborni]
MNLWLIRLLILSAVLGWKDYYQDFRQIFLSGDNLCPGLHVHMPGLHPHQCVSYSQICEGVTQVEARLDENNFQHLCHPRFNTYKMKKDNITVICDGNDLYLLIRLSEDGLFHYSCAQNEGENRCLIYFITMSPLNGYCQFCKPPFYGFNCHKIQEGYDEAKSLPSPYYCGYPTCAECEFKGKCTKCIPRFINPINQSQPQNCQIFCGSKHLQCEQLINGTVQFTDTCLSDYFPTTEFGCWPLCNGCASGYMFKTLDKRYFFASDLCEVGYINLVRWANYQLKWCYTHEGCLTFYTYNINYINSTGEVIYKKSCVQCDLGYYFSVDACIRVSFSYSNCFYMNQFDNNKCIACKPLNALNKDGSCQPITCNKNCQTCLDTNPNFCTTCNLSENRKLDVIYGTCFCLSPYGIYIDICKPCKEGYCNECEPFDFSQCTSCKPESNRILFDKKCFCQPGSYDPGNQDQVCLFCDQSCLTCSGPSNLQCTQCLDESISNRIFFDNSCLCKLGYADYKIKESKCGKCHPRCRTCFQAADETTNQNCLTCFPGENQCQDNYGEGNDASNICLPCHYTCGRCFNSEHTGCIFCLDSSNRYLQTSGECLCKPSYYDDQTNNIQCETCHYSCKECIDSPEKDACIKCPESRVSSDPSAGQFQCICESSHNFDDGFQILCQQCHYSCLTCNGPFSSNCLTCDTTYRQLDYSTCICPNGYYDNGQLKCANCHYSCQRCFDNTEYACIMCSFELQFRVPKGNMCKCADGYYEEAGIAQCQKCSHKCATCLSGPDKCLTCPLNSLRTLDSIKGCLCQDNLYDKNDEIICQKCHFKCKTCSYYGEEKCLSCDSLTNREFKLNQCKCQPHYFEQEVQQCAICSQFCYECINKFDNCTSCYADRYLEGSTCKCTTKFFGGAISTFDGFFKCQQCHFSCGTCRGGLAIDCLTCMEYEHRYQVGNTCKCKNGYFDVGLPVCEKCNYQCKECKYQADSCISCQDNTLRKLNVNKCQCIQKHYDDGKNEICQICHYSCLRCKDIETKCEYCSVESNRTYNEQLFSCDCNIGYYDAGIEICQKCHYSCLNCNSAGSNFCVSCVDSKTSNRIFHNYTCKCLLGYFDDGLSVKCQECDIQCLSCIDQSHLCTSCPQTRQIESNCKCADGYYDVGQQLCQKCNQLCQTCQFTQNNCTSCYTDQFRSYNSITKLCDCQIGYIEINGVCLQCEQSCLSCQESIDNCISCSKFRYLKNNKCICINGMFESIVNKQCEFCDKSCLTCSFTKSYCLTCSIDNYRILTSGNICECIQGYFEDSITQNCEKCEKPCLTCSLLSTYCLTCDFTLHLFLVNNQCKCQQSYYFDSLNNQCEQCHTTCLECSNKSECISCELITRYLDLDLKKCLCNNGFYEINQQSCQKCHFSCETCENINTHCLSCLEANNRILTNNRCLCLDGYYEVEIELCQKCDTICKTCQFSGETCLSCFDIQQLRILSENKCLCQPGYFESNNDDVCQKCSNQCLTCRGSADYCTTCDTNSKRIDQSIIHICPCIIGFYQDQNSNCQKCHIKCQTCINQFDQCLSCQFQLDSNRLSIFGQCNCKEGYFDDGIQLHCQKCHFKCKLCLNKSNNCQICSNVKRISPPTCNCIDGYYEDEQFICQACSSKCNTCQTSPSNCLSCSPGRMGIECKCVDGYYETGAIFCEQCAFKCGTCVLDTLNCETCKGNRIQVPKCICQIGYFDDQKNEDCQQCESTCLECNIYGCLSCNANRILNEEKDCVPPPNSIQYNNTPWCSTCQVAVVQIYLSDDISRIIIHFDFLLSSQGFNSELELNKCLQLFELKSVYSFGQNPVCYLNPDNNQEILILLGENSKINVGDEIIFINNSVSHINCEISIQKFIFTILQMPINLIPPNIEYNVPTHKHNPYAENSINLKSIKNNGLRRLDSIIWSCEVEGNKNTQTLNEFLNYINFLQDYNLLIPKNTLPLKAVLKFKITYQNFIRISSFSEFTIQTHTGELPQIYLVIKPSYYIYETIQIQISAGSQNEQISDDKTQYLIQFHEVDKYPKKSLSSKLNISSEFNAFEKVYGNISKYTLSPNSTYTFQVIVKNLVTDDVQNQNFTINILYAGLICKFNHAGFQSIRKDFYLRIECKDLDTRFEWNNDPDLKIQVSCKDLTLNSVCQNDVNKTDYFQFIKKNFISTFTVQKWTVNVSKFQQSSQFSLIVIYFEEDFPFLELEFNQGYLMRKINNYELLNFTFVIPEFQKHYLFDLSIAIIYNYEIIQILEPKYISHIFKISNSLKELNFDNNLNIKFKAQFSNNIMPSLNKINLSINKPPFCSKLFITRLSDLALTNIQVAATCEQSKDSPYKYQLRLFLRENDLTDFLQGASDYSLLLYPFQNLNKFSIQTPTSIDSSTIVVLLEVLDSGGSITELFEKIITKSASIDCSKIQFEKMIFQNKITLLFEAMNQKCDQLHKRIYFDLLNSQIFSDLNDNILKFQAIKLYQQFQIQTESSKSKIRLLNEDSQKICYNLNSTYLDITLDSIETYVNPTMKIDDFKQSINKLDKTLKYFSKMKKELEEKLNLNQFTWNEEIFQQYQNCQVGIMNLLYQLDEIYLEFSAFNAKNEIVYQTIVELLKNINVIVDEIQDTILVNSKPLTIIGNEIIWQIKRITKQFFNQQFNIEPSEIDYLIDFVQVESTYLKSNPLRFTKDLENQLQIQFNDQTLQIYHENYYQIQLKNVYHSKFLANENFSTIYSIQFGSYKLCTNIKEFSQQFEVQCVVRTIFMNFNQCILKKVQNNDTIDFFCYCYNIGDIFLITSSKFNMSNSSNQSIANLDFNSSIEDLWELRIFTGSLTLIFITNYIYHLYKDGKDQTEISQTELNNISQQNVLDKNLIIYQGNHKIFKEKLKEIHQTISIFCYKDKIIRLSFRVLEVFTQINLLLTLAILECYLINNQILQISLFIVGNSIVILILRPLFKIIESIYRFRKIAALISQLLLMQLLVVPNFILFLLELFNIKMQSESYEVFIIFLGNIIISQAIIEPLIIYARIIIYRLIARSIKSMNLNPIHHLLHFFVIHSSLEEIFNDFTRM